MDRNFDVSTVYVVSVGQARKSLWIETVARSSHIFDVPGQARKSLWIETLLFPFPYYSYIGQARKSLWIETR